MDIISLSLDSSIATTDGDARARLREYASYFDKYLVVVKTDPNEGTHIQDGPLKGISSRSATRYHYLWDAYRIGAAHAAEDRPDVVTTQDAFAVGLVGLLLARRYGSQLHLQLHTDFLDNELWRTESWEHRIYSRLGRFTLPRADAIRVGTNNERRKVQKFAGDVPVTVAPVRMRLEELVTSDSGAESTIRALLGLDDRPVVLFVGRLAPAMNLKRWMSVADGVRARMDADPAFVIVGDGPLRSEIERYAAESDLPLSFPGWVDRSELDGYYDLADVFLITSNYEGTARVVVEAGMNELPVVATLRAGGCLKPC